MTSNVQLKWEPQCCQAIRAPGTTSLMPVNGRLLAAVWSPGLNCRGSFNGHISLLGVRMQESRETLLNITAPGGYLTKFSV